jgi:hypothetical protein
MEQRLRCGLGVTLLLREDHNVICTLEIGGSTRYRLRDLHLVTALIEEVAVQNQFQLHLTSTLLPKSLPSLSGQAIPDKTFDFVRRSLCLFEVNARCCYRSKYGKAWKLNRLTLLEED